MRLSLALSRAHNPGGTSGQKDDVAPHPPRAQMRSWGFNAHDPAGQGASLECNRRPSSQRRRVQRFAAASSSTMPKPPGNSSTVLAGGGLSPSRAREVTKTPASRAGLPRTGRAAVATGKARSSSATMRGSSFAGRCRELAEQTGMARRMRAPVAARRRPVASRPRRAARPAPSRAPAVPSRKESVNKGPILDDEMILGSGSGSRTGTLPVAARYDPVRSRKLGPPPSPSAPLISRSIYRLSRKRHLENKRDLIHSGHLSEYIFYKQNKTPDPLSPITPLKRLVRNNWSNGSCLADRC